MPGRLVVLAIDIGSSSARSALFDERGKRLARTNCAREYAVHYGADGCAVLNPRTLCNAVRQCVAETRRSKRKTAAIGASAFWHSLLGLDKARRPITPIYMWADSRGAADARRLREELDERAVHARTGCMLRASFWPAKLRWLRRTDAALFRRVKFWVSPANWIVEEVFGATGSSESMASATGLYDLVRRQWDEELCDACGVASSRLEEIASTTKASRLDANLFTPIGDGAASNLGSGAERAGLFALNVGTSAAVRTICSSRHWEIPFGLFRYALDEKRQVVGGAVSNAGNLRRWCLRELRVDERSSSRLTRTERVAAATNNLDVLPFWVAERAPSWPENIHGTVAGFTQATTALEIERAAQCSAFYRLAQILELTEAATKAASEVIVSGGILRAPPLLQLLADAIGRDVAVASEREASLRGAAVFALEKLGSKPEPVTRRRVIKHDSSLARLHRERRSRQEALEQTLSSPA